jgi:hypothetical protein
METEYQKIKTLSLTRQQSDLLRTYPTSLCSVHYNTLHWQGNLQPSPLSKSYEVEMIYQISFPPKIYVIGNNLKKLDDPHFPHKYQVFKEENKARICLDRYHVFNKSKYLTLTIIPWTIEWLYFYEIWLATGEWCGGGEHPANNKPKI